MNGFDDLEKTTIRVVVITGASAGVGRATAIEFARTGAAVVLIGRHSGRLEKAAQEVIAAGGRVLVLPLDVADASAIEAAADRIESELGPIDVWVNNAMVTVYSSFSELTVDELKRVTEVTYLGAAYGTHAALKRMRTRNRGVIIQVGSALSYCAIPLQSVYCAAKFALRGLTDAVRVELMHEHSNIHITMVQLSAFNTPQFDWSRSRLPFRSRPVSPVFQPEVAARAIVWSALHRRRELNVGWPAARSVLAARLWPSLTDWVVSRVAVKGQQDENAPVPEHRLDTLFTPAEADYGSHGRFDKIALTTSRQLGLSQQRGKIILGLILIAILTFRLLD